MLNSHAAQWALRAGASSVGRDGDTLAKTFNDTATQQVNHLIAGGNNSGALNQASVQAALATAAVATMVVAYSRISEQVRETGDLRLAYFKELAEGTASFAIRTNKEPGKMYTEENFIKKFIELTATDSFTTYSCQHNTVLPEQNNTFYSVLPFYRTSENLGQPFKNTRLIDRQRRVIDLFLRLAVPDFLSKLDAPFRHESTINSFFRSTWHGNNYSNDYRAARFVVMSLANLLWNLQHPVDPDTRYPHTLDECIALCGKIRNYLNNVLVLLKGECFKHMSKSNPLVDFVRKIDTHVNALWDAYEDERVHEVNIDEMTNSAHQTLEIMDKSILNILYKQHSIQACDPMFNAADHLIDKISYLQGLFLLNPRLIEWFPSNNRLNAKQIKLNVPATTVIDALIMFCHMTKVKREELIVSLKKNQTASVLELAATLELFNKEIIRPIDKVSKEELWRLNRDRSYITRAELTAQRLIPFITFVIDDYGIDVDTPLILEKIKRTPGLYNSKQQIEMINQMVQSNEVTSYYKLTLSPFLNANEETVTALNQLIKNHTRMRHMTKLLDGVGELINDYRNFLQHKDFQLFLNKCLNRVSEEYTTMNKQISRFDIQITDDESMSHNLKQILGQMTSEMTARLKAFLIATNNLNGVIASPDFPEEQKQLLEKKIDTINQQFLNLFHEASGLEQWLTIDQFSTGNPLPPETVIAPEATMPSEIKISSNQMIALSKLAHNCYDGLSFSSKYGCKGVLLLNLIETIDTNPDFTTEQFNHIVKELVKVSATYRETYFFQAAYGQSRSAKVIIKAIQDPHLKNTLPLASILFSTESIDFSEQSEEQIVKALNTLCIVKHWQTTANQMTVTKTHKSPEVANTSDTSIEDLSLAVLN